MIMEGINAFLAADAAVKGLLGLPSARSDSTNGIFPDLAPEQVPMPYIVVELVAGMPLDESFAGTGALQTDRMRFKCYATTYKGAVALARAAMGALISCNGNIGGFVQIQGAWLKFRTSQAEAITRGTLFTYIFDMQFNWLDLQDAQLP